MQDAVSDVREMYAAPYRCFYGPQPSPSQVHDAHELLMEVVEEEGPFEGILGFSQGGEIAALFLLGPGKDLFKYAVFIGSTVPWDISSLEATGNDHPRKMHGSTHSAKIDMPTAHIIGRSDAYRDFAKITHGLCNNSKAKVYDHHGAHVVPRGQDAMEDLTMALDWVVDRSTFQ